ncbi:MAG: hypothetical protein NO474_00445 [Methanomassiliicoccales archaeon]|jgi:hypothetical protein|nr:hypothetical protein [Methanomassiliicoccales archaeon]
MQEFAERDKDVRPDTLGNAISIPDSHPKSVLGEEYGVTVEGTIVAIVYRSVA